MTDRLSIADIRRRLAHVRWIAGGAGAGKSTVTRALAERHDVLVYDGDRAELGYVHRCDPRRQPYLWTLLRTPTEDRWASRTAEEIFHAMPSLHGETFGFVLDDLLALPADRSVLVDDFRTLPREVAPLLTRPGHAVFLLPTPEFRARALGDRFADPARARANWGNGDHAVALAKRLARDRLWDEEVRRQARELELPVLSVDGSRGVADLATELAAMFQLVR
ncbi:hypothetical protein [Microbispora siamensis]|uniref:AAA domain-containing protein n=1 Tax=Microbispora siamensis TaxID=564413 RepID=A0ABQ4GUV1_9ACTN|nr:hypothetical protein [Microbispora siamensis]GIH65214.1 hypothetical protein Msi02_60310 [Microbispora siamensis]